MTCAFWPRATFPIRRCCGSRSRRIACAMPSASTSTGCRGCSPACATSRRRRLQRRAPAPPRRRRAARAALGTRPAAAPPRRHIPGRHELARSADRLAALCRGRRLAMLKEWRADLIYATVPPLTGLLVARRLARRLRHSVDRRVPRPLGRPSLLRRAGVAAAAGADPGAPRAARRRGAGDRLGHVARPAAKPLRQADHHGPQRLRSGRLSARRRCPRAASAMHSPSSTQARSIRAAAIRRRCSRRSRGSATRGAASASAVWRRSGDRRRRSPRRPASAARWRRMRR